jgi:ABC-2 type transport system ATP-binding protein
MRELLKKLNHVFGVTIIISSHLLSEIEKLVTHVGVINKGQMLFEGTLLQLEQKQQQGVSTSIHTNNQIDALRLIRDVDSTATIVKEHIVIPTVNQQIIAAINKQLVNNDIEVYQITTVKNDLETIFINMVNTTA